MLETRTIRSDEVKVGDIIKVLDDQIVPADCFLLTSGTSERQSDNNGQCFISTGSLDGERNLKPKMAIRQVEQNFFDLVTGSGRDVIIEVNQKDGPVANLYQFNADLKIVYADR